MGAKGYGRVRVHLGRVITPLASGEWQEFSPGFLAVGEDGGVVSCGEWDGSAKGRFSQAEVVDHLPCVISPGFVDAHIHLPQLDARGMAGYRLLEWLERYIYPAEMAFEDTKLARCTARRFLRELVANGVTTAAIYSSVHFEATQVVFEEAAAFGYRAVIGKVLMDRNAPASLLQDPEKAIEESIALCERWHGYQNRLFYAFTPRFAPSCSDRLLRLAGEAAASLGAYVQTHLSENLEEVELVKGLFPHSSSYTEVYLEAGLLGERTVVGHAIHLEPRELEILSSTATKVAHCPSSNLFLHSGRMNLPLIEKEKIPVALGSDVGAGPSLSPFEVMRDAYYLNITRPSKLFFYATRGGAEVLGMEDRVGSFEEGKEADFVVIDPRPVKEAGSPLEELFSRLIFWGQKNLVVATYVRGRRLFP